MSTNAGFWIVVEGIDGAGKTTAIQTVIEFLKTHHFLVKTFREPGGTPLGELVRSVLKTDGLAIRPLAEVLLFYAARYQLLETEIIPNLQAGTSVVLDRHELSTFAYQAGGRGVDISEIQKISAVCLQGRKPDLTIYLSVSPEKAYERMLLRGQLDHIEQQDLEFFHRVTEAYDHLLQNYPHVIRIDANQALEAVQKEIVIQLGDWLKC